jgi:hypothetical protein
MNAPCSQPLTVSPQKSDPVRHDIPNKTKAIPICLPCNGAGKCDPSYEGQLAATKINIPASNPLTCFQRLTGQFFMCCIGMKLKKYAFMYFVVDRQQLRVLLYEYWTKFQWTTPQCREQFC